MGATTKIEMGSRFNKWTVLEEFPKRTGNRSRMMVRVCCECGQEAVLAKSAVMGGKTKGCIKCRERHPQVRLRATGTERAFLNVWNSYLVRSRRKGIPFELNKEQFRALIIQDCFYCDEPPSNTLRAITEWGQDMIYNGIDRYEPEKGYVEGNCLPCCKYCNRMKSDLSFDDFFERVGRLSRKWGDKPVVIVAKSAQAGVLTRPDK
jgi:hypothetical protein